MDASARSRAIWIGAAVVALVIVAAIAYNVGIADGRGGAAGFMPMGRYGFGYGLFGLGLVAPVLFFLLVAAVLAIAFGPGPRYRGTPPPPPPAGPSPAGPSSGVDQLRELADLHARGALNDEEFAAAKRRLLGL